MGESMSNARIITCTLAIAGVLFIGSQVSDRQAIAQGPPGGGPPGGLDATIVNTPLPVTVTNPTELPSTVNVAVTNTALFKVKVCIDHEVTQEAIKDYIANAVTSWGGELHPDDPCFGLTRRIAKVTPLKTQGSSEPIT
jgi:hypothetical protein